MIAFFFGTKFSLAQEDFSNMSPKQRIKVAKKEQKAAKKDKEYLALMDEALIAFQAKDYSKAQDLYQKAHERRPDNVYPMVMLDDIALAIEAEEKQVETEEILVEEEVIEEKPQEQEVKAEEAKPEEAKSEPKEEEIVMPVD